LRLAEIVKRLKNDHGIKVSPQYVSTIKSNAKRIEKSTVSSNYNL